jgi:DNA polymerase-4
VRTIVHADLDAFYASVEQLDRPELRGRPVVVGGPPEARGVVAAASYEARRFGVRSAMPMSRAMRLCPDAVRVPPRFQRYGEISHQVMAYFRSITPLVEPLSLDEAFLDVSEVVDRHGGAEALGRRLKSEVKHRTALTISVGIGSNKTVAKIASDMQKPDGLVVVAPGDEASFLAPLPVRALWGVGPKAESALHAAGMRTVADLAQAHTGELERRFGARGLMLQEMARGHDDRAVEPVHERKSVGAETTFAQDLPDGPELRGELERMARETAHRLVAHGSLARTVALKLRYANFRTITRQSSVPEPIDGVEEIVRIAHALLSAVVEPGDRFRLIGVQCTNLSGDERRQLSLWPGAADAVLG